jgi:putative ABC transport system substrate-binding protein
MFRRSLLFGILVLAMPATPPTTAAQTSQKAVTIGFLGNSSAALESKLVEAFREGMRDLGYEEGKNLVIRYQWAQGRPDRLSELAGEFVRNQVDAIITGGTPGTLAAKKAAAKIPIVMVGVGDPLGAGLVSSLAKPGGNVTGLATLARELEGKGSGLNCSSRLYRKSRGLLWS